MAKSTLYTLPDIKPDWKVSCCACETLVAAYISHIDYLEANGKNAFEITLCDKLKNNTNIYKIRDLIIEFRSRNKDLSSTHKLILDEFTRRLNPITNTWQCESTLSPCEKNMKIGAIASAIKGRIDYFHSKLFRNVGKKNSNSDGNNSKNTIPSYNNISSDWIANEFASYVNSLSDLANNLIADTRTAISNANIAGKTEASNKVILHNNIMEYSTAQSMTPFQYPVQYPMQYPIPGLYCNGGVPTILVLTEYGTVVQSQLVQ